MSLTVSHCCWLSLTVSMELLHVSQCLPRLLAVSLCLSVQIKLQHISNCFLLSLTVSLSARKLLHVSNCHLWLLAVSHYLYGLIELLHFYHYLPLLLVMSHCLSQCHGVAICCSMSLIVDNCLSLSPRSCCMSFSVSHGCWVSLIVPPVPLSCNMSPMVAGSLSLSLFMPMRCCISLTLSYGY